MFGVLACSSFALAYWSGVGECEGYSPFMKGIWEGDMMCVHHEKNHVR